MIFRIGVQVAQQLHLGASFEQNVTSATQVHKAVAEARPKQTSAYGIVKVCQAHKGSIKLSPAAAKLRYRKPTVGARKLAGAAAYIKSKVALACTRYTRTRATKSFPD